MLGAVGTYVYKNVSDEKKKTFLSYLKRAVDWLPERVRGYIPHTLLNKLKGDDQYAGISKGSVGKHDSSGNNAGGSRGQGSTGFQSAGSR